MRIKFCGANRSVTGSQHLLEINGRRLLLDCGLFQGHRAEAWERNQSFLYEPAAVDAMVLSHAHIDHSGNIPNLVRQGFKGPIYCTPPTVDLCKVMLQDSAFIQERDVEFLNKRLAKRGEILKEPLYTLPDALASFDQFRGIGLGKSFEPIPGARVTLFNAGHMFGSAMILIEVFEKHRSLRFAFSGDLGRKNLPIIEDPDQITFVDALICESTYGNKLHDPAREIQGDLVRVIHEAVEKNGKIIVPAFSVERTQEIVYHLNKLYERKQVPAIPVFVDSPLAVNVTDVFMRHHEYYDAEASYLLSNNDNPFAFKGLHYITKVDDSKKLNQRKEPCIIISASGMCEAGRILHHLANNIENPSTTVLIVGFMAEHTLGRKLVDRHETVRIFGDEYKLNARVVKLNSFSGHADKADLLAFCGKIGRQAHTFLVHGEEPQANAFMETLRSEGFKHVSIPELSTEVEL